MNKAIISAGILALSLSALAAEETRFNSLGPEVRAQPLAAGVGGPSLLAHTTAMTESVSTANNRSWGLWRYLYGRWDTVAISPALAASRRPPLYLVGDFDGDGCQDLQIIAPPDSGQAAVSQLMLGSSDGAMRPGGAGLGTAWAASRSWSFTSVIPGFNDPAGTYQISKYEIRTGDFNGDKKTDFCIKGVVDDELFIVFSEVDANGKWKGRTVSVPKPSDYGITNWAGTSTNMNRKVYLSVLDFDGDGRTDLMARLAEGGGTKDRTMVFLIAQEDGSFTPHLLRLVNSSMQEYNHDHWSSHGQFAGTVLKFADINGDKLPDIFLDEVGGTDGDDDIRVFINRGKSYGAGAKAIQFEAFLGDRWGDGSPRIPSWTYETGSNNYATEYARPERTEWFFGDFDGDGYTDMFAREHDGWNADNAMSTTLGYATGDSSLSLQIGCFPYDDFAAFIEGNQGGRQSFTTAPGRKTGCGVIIADFDGNGRDEILGWQATNGSSRGMRHAFQNSLRGSWNYNTVSLPNAASTWLNLLSGDFNGDGKAELMVVRGGANDLRFELFQSGAWYEPRLSAEETGNKSLHYTTQAIEAVDVAGTPVLFKRGAVPGVLDAGLAWTSLRSDGTWMPWKPVLLEEKDASNLPLPFYVEDRPFSVIADGARLLFLQRDFTAAGYDRGTAFRGMRFVFTPASGQGDPELTQYTEIVYNYSGTAVPDTSVPGRDDFLVSRPEREWKLQINDYLRSANTPSTNLHGPSWFFAANSFAGYAEAHTSDLSPDFDATFLPGVNGPRLTIVLPYQNWQPNGYWRGVVVMSIRTKDGRPAPRGVNGNFSLVPPEDREPQYYHHTGQEPAADGSGARVVLPDCVARVLVADTNQVRLVKRPSLTPCWNHAQGANGGAISRSSLALKVGCVGNDSSVQVFHLPVDENGLPALYCDPYTLVRPDASAYLVNPDPNQRLIDRTERMPFRVSFTPPGNNLGMTAPRLYQGIDGHLHVLVGSSTFNGYNSVLYEGLFPTTFMPGNQVSEVFANRCRDEQRRWLSSGSPPDLVRGAWTGSILQPIPALMRTSKQPSVIEFVRTTPVAGGIPRAAMWRSLVGYLDLGLSATSPMLIFVGKPQRLTQLETAPMGFVLVNPQMVGFIESAPPLPPDLVGRGRTKSSVTLEAMANASFSVGKSGSDSFVASVEGHVVGHALKTEIEAGTANEESWAVSTASLESTSLTSTSRIKTTGSVSLPCMRQLGQVVFQGDKAILLGLFIPGTNPSRAAGTLVQPITPAQTITRIYPFGLRQGFLDLSNWQPAVGANAVGSVIAPDRLAEEVSWTTRVKVARARSLSRTASDEALKRQIDLGDLRNTYMWSAYGGFRAATEQRTNSTSRSFTGFGNFLIQAGVQTNLSWETPLTGLGMEVASISALAGYSCTWNSTSTSSEEGGLGMTVTYDIDEGDETYLNYALAEVAKKPAGQPVDAVEFSTFYLRSGQDNFQDFYNKVLNPAWLGDHGTPGTATNVAIIRDAMQNLYSNFRSPRKIWRIAHRVTYISRLYQAQLTTATELK